MPLPTPNPRKRGEEVEQAVARWLEARGLVLIDSNRHAKGGEIDLIMRDGETLVFIEVRHRRNVDYGHPLETVTAAKQRRIIKAARFYLQTQRLFCSCRFDVVGATGPRDAPIFDWIRAAFDAY